MVANCERCERVIMEQNMSLAIAGHMRISTNPKTGHNHEIKGASPER